MSKKNYFSFVLSLSILLIPNFNTINFAQTPPTNNQNANNTEALNPRDYNVLILSDERILVMMAALTLAGYKYEGAGKLADLQTTLRQDLKATSPDLIKKNVL